MSVFQYYYAPGESTDFLNELIGHKISSVKLTFVPGMYRKVDVGSLILDNGVTLTFGGNSGACTCGSGDYNLITDTFAKEIPGGIIMNAEIEDAPIVGGDIQGEPVAYEGTYRLFIIADNKRIPLAEFEGSDGNPYYGTGFWVRVTYPHAKS